MTLLSQARHTTGTPALRAPENLPHPPKLIPAHPTNLSFQRDNLNDVSITTLFLLDHHVTYKLAIFPLNENYLYGGFPPFFPRAQVSPKVRVFIDWVSELFEKNPLLQPDVRNARLARNLRRRRGQ